VRGLLLPLLSGLLAAVACAAAAAPAWAHTRLVSSTPAQATPAEAPREVVLVFTDPVQPGLSAVSVTGSDGEEQASGAPSGGGDATWVSQALHSPLEPGTYRVGYRVLAADGHPVTGSFEITAVAPAAAAPTPTPSRPTSATTSTDALRPAAGLSDDGGLPLLPLVVGGLVLAGVTGVLARRLGGAPPSA
jgi:methionine-rich copper-binding protein CopC